MGMSSLNTSILIFVCTVAICSYLLTFIPDFLPVHLSSDVLNTGAPNGRRSAFQATRLTGSTFLVKEYNDVYSEHPHIYAKIVPSANTVLVVDTGCGGATNDSDIEVTSLRKFIETVGVDSNSGKPLNEGGTMSYIVVTTHCHYDHILGVEQFKDSPILASSHSPLFLAPSVLPENSLCTPLGIETPTYTPTLVPHLHSIRSPSRDDVHIGVSIIHTPGHTPDELALYDETEKLLYVGDSLYEHEEIIFPKEGSIVAWFSSIDYLISFVKSQEEINELSRQEEIGSGVSKEVLLNAGHCTVMQPALEVLLAAKSFMQDVVGGKETVQNRMIVREEETVVYRQEGNRFSLRCPERLVVEAREMHGV